MTNISISVMKVSFQYLSDIHLESYQYPDQTWSKIKACAPYLIIAGDLGNVFSPWYQRFLSEVSPLFTYVFIISGNHEYYGKNRCIADVDQWIQYVDHVIDHVTKAFKNVIFLQNKAFLIPKTRIAVYGTTLWSEIYDDDCREIGTHINSYRNIAGFTPDKSRQLFKNSLKQLVKTLETYPDYQFVVISHHLPSFDLICPQYRNSPKIKVFASQVAMSILNHKQIVAWVAGHTHIPTQLGKFYVNPIGYCGENPDADFNKVFTVPRKSHSVFQRRDHGDRSSPYCKHGHI